MPTVTCTPGGASDNCYVTEAQANTYFGDTLRESTWEGWPATDRQRALIQATSMIENLGGPRASADNPARPLFVGYPYASTQALHFPRETDLDSDSAAYVPEAVRDAVCEQAYWLLDRKANPPIVDTQQLRDEGISQMSADGMSLTMRAAERPRDIAPAAADLIAAYRRSRRVAKTHAR